MTKHNMKAIVLSPRNLRENAWKLMNQYKIPTEPECEFCGSTKNLQRHHPNYNKPLWIITLCAECHMNLHGIERTLKINDGMKPRIVWNPVKAWKYRVLYNSLW